MTGTPTPETVARDYHSMMDERPPEETLRMLVDSLEDLLYQQRLAGRLEGAQRLVDAGYVDQDQADAVLAADEDGDEA